MYVKNRLTSKNKTLTCSFCKTKEGRLRAVTLGLVKITYINVFGTHKPLCQHCNKQFKKALEARKTHYSELSTDKGLFYLRKLLQLVSE